MKTCVSSYSFNNLLRSGEYDQLSLMKKVKDMGFDAIEFTDLNPPKGIGIEDFAKQIREESEKINLPVANYTIGGEFLNCESLDAEVERLHRCVDIAQILGASGMRHDATGGFKGVDRTYKGFDQALRVLVEGCRRVTDYATEKGIVTMVENHGFFCQDSLRVESLVTGVGKENFGVLLDMGNFLCVDEAPELACSLLAPFVKHVHCKDFHVKSGNEPNPGEGFFMSRGGNYLRGAIVGHGNVPVKQCLAVVAREGYKGYVSIEFEGMEENIKAMEIGLDNLKSYIDSL
ncbi:MAG TPA: sugar phosphate isomerase/epimerase family protein [Clostridiales bacterium]|nr:sugar phosphate isomerase/epimerase family protein [Clostridiales bacterium]